MVFTASTLSKKQENNTEPTQEKTQVIQEIDFLKSKTEEDKSFDPYQKSLNEKFGLQYTMKTLNAIKILSPILTALMQRPGVDAKNGELEESFKQVITAISELSESVCDRLGVDVSKSNNFWIRNVLERNFSQILGEQWIVQGNVNQKKILSLLDSVIDFAEHVPEKETYIQNNDDNQFKIGLFTSMLPVLREATNFSLYREFENDIPVIQEKLQEYAKSATQMLAHDLSSYNDKLNLFNILVKEAGEIYAVSWKVETLRIKNIINSYEDKDKISAVIEKYKNNGGFPLDRVDNEFVKYFEKLVVNTEKLVQNQKGNMKSRLNTP